MSNPINQEEQFNSAVAQLERGQNFDNALGVLDQSSVGQIKPLLEIVVAAQKLPFFSLPDERSKILAAALTTKLVNTPPVIGPTGDANFIAPIALDSHRLRRNIWGPKVASALAAVALLVLVFGGLFWLAQQAPEQLGASPSPAVTSNPLVPTVNLTEITNPAITSPVNTWGNKTPTNTGAETAQTTVKAAYNTYTPKPATTGNDIVPTTATSGATNTTNSSAAATTVGNTTVNTTRNTTVSTTPPAIPTPTPEVRTTTGATTTTTNTTSAPTAPAVQPTPTPGQTTDTAEPSKTPKTPSPTPAPTTDNSGKGGGGGKNDTPSPTKTNGGGGGQDNN